MFESKNKSLRESAILTTSYVVAELFEDLSTYNQLALAIDFTKGSLTSAEIKVEFFVAGKWVQETASSISGGSSTETLLDHVFTASGVYDIKIPIKCAKVRISAKGTGTVTGSLMEISALVGQV